MPSRPSVFQFDTSFSVSLSESKYIFTLGLYSSPCNFFSMLFIHSAFLLCFLRSHILLKIFLFPCHPVAGMSSCILPLLTGRIFFRYFGMSCFVCIVLSCLDIFLVFLLSPVPSDFFPWFVLFALIVMSLFSFRPNIFQRFSSVLSFFIVVVDFLYVFPV